MSVAPIKGSRLAPKVHRSSMDTLVLTVDQVNQWRVPPFQRPVRVNGKVLAIAEALKTDPTITGMLTLGKLTGDKAEYIVDGQHRMEAFRISGVDEVLADVRVVHFDTMADMADEFVQVNTAIVRMRPDDLLRGLTPSLPNVAMLMKECPFIGYDNVRRKDHSGPIVGLSAVIRCWYTSASEAPSSTARDSITHSASALDTDSAEKLARFLNMALAAWGRDPEYYRLWGNLNMALCMWLYRRLVLDVQRKATARVMVLNETQFRQCLTALSASAAYLEWLPGRLLSDRDRSPAFSRIKQIFTKRLADSGVTKAVLPQPAWASR